MRLSNRHNEQISQAYQQHKYTAKELMIKYSPPLAGFLKWQRNIVFIVIWSIVYDKIRFL